MMVHNHGTREGPGLACREQLVGACILGELLDAAKECADDLEAEVRHQYGWPTTHPAMLRRLHRDLAPVGRIRAAIAALAPAVEVPA